MVWKRFLFQWWHWKNLGTTAIGHMYTDSTDMTSPHSYQKEFLLAPFMIFLTNIYLWHHSSSSSSSSSSTSRFGPVSHTEVTQLQQMLVPIFLLIWLL
jgi:hypothetical protein